MPKPYSTIIDGQEVYADTPEGLLLLIKAGKTGAGPARTAPNTKTKPQSFNPPGQFKRINKLALHFFQFLKQRYPNPVRGDVYAAEIGRPPRVLSMVMGGLAVWSKMVNVPVDALVKRSATVIDGKHVSLYQITEEGIKALENAQREKELERLRYGGTPKKRG